MEINAAYLRKLSKEGSKVNKKVEEILENLVDIAKRRETTADIIIIEKYEGLYKRDIMDIKQLLLNKGFKVTADSAWDDEDMTEIWEFNISW